MSGAGTRAGRREPWNAATVLLFVVGCGFLVATAWSGWRMAAFLSEATRVTGTVIDPEGHPRIRFTTADGRAAEFNQNGFLSRPLGAAVPVAYLTADPAGTAQADTFWADWGVVLGFLWLGLGFTGLPLLGARAEFRPGRW